jgi:hypothetical protein
MNQATTTATVKVFDTRVLGSPSDGWKPPGWAGPVAFDRAVESVDDVLEWVDATRTLRRYRLHESEISPDGSSDENAELIENTAALGVHVARLHGLRDFPDVPGPDRVLVDDLRHVFLRRLHVRHGHQVPLARRAVVPTASRRRGRCIRAGAVDASEPPGSERPREGDSAGGRAQGPGRRKDRGAAATSYDFSGNFRETLAQLTRRGLLESRSNRKGYGLTALGRQVLSNPNRD